MAMVFEKETNLYQNGAIASKFRSQDTQFQVIQGKIAYLISDSEIEHYDDGSGTITSRLNTAESTIRGNTSLISELRTEYDALTGEITEYESSTNEYKQTTNETISTITQTVQTKTKTFNTIPTPPYSVNDLWFKNKELYICTNSKVAGQIYSESDWVLATRYTDDSAITTFINSTYASDMSNLQTQVDGKIETWNQPEDPSIPWTSISLREKHEGDLWYRTTDSTTWRYNGGSWVEQNIPNSVLANINGKAKIFVAEPTVPYSVGDLWVQGSTGDILRCEVDRSTGSFVAGDWTKASKYTDDAAITQFVNNTYNPKIASIESALDGKIDTWFYNYAPSLTKAPTTAWATDELKDSHLDDLFYDTSTGFCYRFTKSGSTYSWTRIKDSDITSAMTAASLAQDTADGKRRVFVVQPTPPYDIGDLWVEGSSGDIWKCKTARASGSFSASHWEKASKYTDDTALNNWKGNTYQTFQSFIDQLPSQINLTVEASGKYAAKASIIAEINQSTEQSSVKINADRIALEGNTVINAINNGTGSVTINADKINLSSYSTKTYAESLVQQTSDEINSRVSGIENLKNSSYSGTVAPKSYNYPASDWSSVDVKYRHHNDLYYDETTGYVYQYKVTANGLMLTFSDSCRTANSSDYVIIYYQFGSNIFKSQEYSSSSIAGKSIFIPSKSFWVYWHTSPTGNAYYGFSFNEVETVSDQTITGTIVNELPDFDVIEVSEIYEIQSDHNPYLNNEDKLWRYTHPESISTKVSATWERRKDSDLGTAESEISQLSGEISLKVSRGDIASAINLTDQSALIEASKINLSGYATFTSLATEGETVINGGNITTGYLSAYRIKGGRLYLGGDGNADGELFIRNSSGTVIGKWNSDGVNITRGSINIGSGNFTVDTDGGFGVKSDYLTIQNGTITSRNSADGNGRSAILNDGKLGFNFSNSSVGSITPLAGNAVISGSPEVSGGIITLNSDAILRLTAGSSAVYINGAYAALCPNMAGSLVVIARNVSNFARIGSFNIYTNDLKMNGESGYTGSFVANNKTFRVVNGIIIHEAVINN